MLNGKGFGSLHKKLFAALVPSSGASLLRHPCFFCCRACNSWIIFAASRCGSEVQLESGGARVETAVFILISQQLLQCQLDVQDIQECVTAEKFAIGAETKNRNCNVRKYSEDSKSVPVKLIHTM